MHLHVAKDWAGSFAVLMFLHSSILAFGRGHTIKQLLQGPGQSRIKGYGGPGQFSMKGPYDVFHDVIVCKICFR